MASIFRARKDASTTNHNGGGDGSGGGGGKIMRGRRTIDASSPYSRPPSTSASENPNPNPNRNRLVRLISPVITGAAKIISTVFFPDTSPTSSSSSSEYDSENGDDISSEGDDSLNQNAETSEANAYFEKKLQLNVPQNEIKPTIERLLMQETFSRDECNKLVKIIESRVVEFPAKVGGDTGRHQGGHGTDISNSAVLEAKRWVEENNWGSHSQLDKSRGNFTPSPSNFTGGELGSPVLMAKSYMKSRPQWTSPTAANSEYQTASPIGLYVSKEETPHATMANDLSLSKDLKRSLAVDTPDSLEGSRRVRFKIAENKARPIAACYNLQEENSNVEAAKRDATLRSDALPTKGFVKKSPQLSVDSPKNNGCSVSQGSGHLTSFLLNNDNQDLEGGQIKQERSTNRTTADIVLETQDDSHWQDDYPNIYSDRFGANGSTSALSLAARVNTRSSPRAGNEEGLNVMTTSSNWEGSYELLSEFSIEVPRDEETNDATGPANDPNKQSREQIVTETTSVSNPGMKRRSSSAKVEKQVTKKTTNPPSRRGRGRGRGRGK